MVSACVRVCVCVCCARAAPAARASLTHVRHRRRHRRLSLSLVLLRFSLPSPPPSSFLSPIYLVLPSLPSLSNLGGQARGATRKQLRFRTCHAVHSRIQLRRSVLKCLPTFFLRSHARAVHVGVVHALARRRRRSEHNDWRWRTRMHTRISKRQC